MMYVSTAIQRSMNLPYESVILIISLSSLFCLQLANKQALSLFTIENGTCGCCHGNELSPRELHLACCHGYAP